MRDKKLRRNSDLVAEWDGSGALWLSSQEAGVRLQLPPQVVMLLDTFDGERTVGDVIGALAGSQEDAAQIGNLIALLHERHVLIDDTFESTYFRNYHFGDHHSMLRDAPRMASFRDALNASVTPETRVADLGTGTGVLAFFACQAGAREVLAVEGSGWIDMARQVANANGLGDRITFIRDQMERVSLDAPVDLIVSECLDSLLIDARMLPHVLMFRDQHLAPGGRIMPTRGAIYLVPVDTPDAHHDWLGRWSEMKATYGLDFAPLEALARSQSHRRLVGADAPLAPEAEVFTIDLQTAKAETPSFDSDVSYTVSREGTLHGFAGYFTVWLTDEITLTTAPDAPATHWQQHFFPIPALEVAAGDEIACRFVVGPATGNKRRLDATLTYEVRREGVGTVAEATAEYLSF